MPYTAQANQIRASFHSKAELWIYLAKVHVIRKLNNVIRKLNNVIKELNKKPCHVYWFKYSHCCSDINVK